jgi:O-methyltransferase involved in polyketide biosynthesis
VGSAPFDTSVPHPARVYDYWLGGKDNFAADRQMAEEVLRVMPVMAQIARSCRLFLSAVVHHLAADLGVVQFLDIGTGLPTADNTHEVAQRAVPEARVVYVDNDPIVLAHSRALLRAGRRGRCAYIDADARDVGKILAEAAGTLDFTQPVAVIMLGLLHYIPDSDEAYSLPGRYLDAFVPGSYLAISHASSDIAQATIPITLRPREEFARFFRDLDLVPPGIAPLGQWVPGATETGPPTLPTYTALARKP